MPGMSSVGDRHELRALVDRLGEIFKRNVAVGRARHVHYPRTARLLGMPDLRIPICAHQQPLLQVGFEGSLHAVCERASGFVMRQGAE
jgi:hypothetical protein